MCRCSTAARVAKCLGILLLLGEVRLSDPAIRSARFTAPALYTRGASERLVRPGSRRPRDRQRRSVLCFCVAGLFGEDLVQRGYRSVSAALAYLAARLGAATRQVAHAIRTSALLSGISTASPVTVCLCSPRTARTWLRVGWPWLRRA